jgi:tryptophan 2,3-dioxygenase
MSDNQRDLEAGIQTDLNGQMTYGGYLHLDILLSAQQPLSQPPHHDEMLFIVQHHVSELWMKLLIHELKAAVAHLQADDIDACLKILARVKQVQRQLFEQWAVLETLTPSEYLEFRGVLGPSSGFQSLQYRQIEFLLGNKNADMLKVFAHDPAAQSELRAVLEAPSLYDEFLRYLARRGHAVPAELLQRDWTEAYRRNEALLPVLKRIYEQRAEFWPEYHMCEQLVDVEESFQLWRFRHMKTVERIIGHRRGTGGSSGVSFLKKALDLEFFPELLDVRTVLGSCAGGGSCCSAFDGRAACGYIWPSQVFSISRRNRGQAWATPHSPAIPGRYPTTRNCSGIRVRCGCCSCRSSGNASRSTACAGRSRCTSWRSSTTATTPARQTPAAPTAPTWRWSTPPRCSAATWPTRSSATSARSCSARW